MKKVRTFRPDYWLVELVEKHAKANGMIAPATGEFNFSKALHGVVRELQAAANAAKDINIYRNYSERLAKEIKPFLCHAMQSNVTILECYNCQERAKNSPASVPPAVRECPRNKGSVGPT